MLRLVYLLLSMASACLVASGAMASDTAVKTDGQVSLPNILLLVADDLGYNDSAIYQDVFRQQPVMHMPALESLAQQGVRFTRFYTESTCSASRAALLTGQYPARSGFMPVARGISPDVITLPEYLQSRGYATHLVGKWHVGEVNREAFPQYQGFDSVFGFLSQWLLRGPGADGKQMLKSPTYNNPWLMEVSPKKPAASYRQYHGHLEDILTQGTVDLIRSAKNSKQPWFIDHAFFAPHTPLEPASRFAKRFESSPEGKYQALLAQMDDSLLQIMTALKESGQWDNTIIIFASDNGSPEKDGKTTSNAPFSGKKAEYEEGGIRTPLVIKWPKNLQMASSDKKTTRSDVVSIMDIYPSLVKVTGGSVDDFKKLDGIPDLLPAYAQARSTPLYFLSYGALSVLSADGRYRLLRSWDEHHFTQTQLFEYNADSLPVDVSDEKTSDHLFADFLQWRHQWRVVPLQIKNSNITGSDFLRTPVNPSFAVSFSFTANNTENKQRLLFQKGTTDVTLEKGVLRGIINGLSVKADGIKAQTTYQVVLSGEFYDRFSGVQSAIRTSRLHLILNGKEVDSASGSIHDLANVDITAPTVMGNISTPLIYSTQLLPDDTLFP